MADDYDRELDRNTASNMSIQPGMKQDQHPSHNMPAPEHDGTQLPYDYNNKGRGMLKDREYGSIMSKRKSQGDSAVAGDDE